MLPSASLLETIMATHALRRTNISASPQPVRLQNGRMAWIRDIELADVQRERSFLSRLSPESRAYRFLALIKEANEDVARELTVVDPEREVVLGAFIEEDGCEIEIGVARYLASTDGRHCDCTVTVDPEWQKLGVGRELMHRLISAAQARGIGRMYAVDAARCAGAHSLAERLGFHARPDPEDPAVTTFELVLG
jgi:GNAT superfamily N-acetyltransferase